MKKKRFDQIDELVEDLGYFYDADDKLFKVFGGDGTEPPVEADFVFQLFADGQHNVSREEFDEFMRRSLKGWFRGS